MNTKLTLAVLLWTATLTEGQVPTYQVVDLGTLGGNLSYAKGINSIGQVVGCAGTDSGWTHAFLYSNGMMQDLGTLGGLTSYANGINDNSQIVGNYSSGNSYYAFLYSNGMMQDLGTLSGVSGTSDAYAINNSGQIVGSFSTPGGWHAYLYSAGSLVDIHTLGNSSTAVGINDSGQVTGTFFINTSSNTLSMPFLYSNGMMQDLGTLGGNRGQSYGINASGKVVGEAYTAGNAGYHVFVYSAGVIQDLNITGDNGPPRVFGVGINSAGQVAISRSTNYHSYLYSNGMTYDLNDLIYPSEWTIAGVNAINDSGQIAATGWSSQTLGNYHALRLDPLPFGWKQAIETQPPQPTYGTCPNKEPGKDSLIVVTHGWTSRELNPLSPPDPVWVDSMASAINSYLTSQGLSRWKVCSYKWVEKSWKFIPSDALEQGKEEGKKLGECLAMDRWDRIHFIAHSAGSALIQAATDVIKDSANGSSATIIHETFLDPFVGFGRLGVTWYGEGADWAENYFAHDLLTGGEAWQFTEGPLEYTYNVDVTRMDSEDQAWTYFSTPSGITLKRCSETINSSHAWAHVFYANTIPPSTQPDSEGFGFPLSKEGGNWAFALANYPPGINSLKILKPPLGPHCGQGLYQTTPAVIGPKADFSNLPSQQSTTGVIQKNGYGIKLTPGSPAWLATFVTLTNSANLVSFEAKFEGTNGAGLLTVYWDTNMIGTVDERAVQPGLQHYMFKFPNALANSSHMLGFRMDSFTNIQSSTVITNTAFGFSGVSQPFRLSVTTNVSDGLRVSQLTGQSGFIYMVEASTNLVNWDAIALLVNTNGIVRFVDVGSSNAPKRFYRAVAAY